MKLKSLLESSINEAIKIPNWGKKMSTYDLKINKKLLSRASNIFCARNKPLTFNQKLSYLSFIPTKFSLEENQIAATGGITFGFDKDIVKNASEYLKKEHKNLFAAAKKLIDGKPKANVTFNLSTYDESGYRWDGSEYIDETFKIKEIDKAIKLIESEINKDYGKPENIVIEFLVILEGDYILNPSDMEIAKQLKSDFETVDDLAEYVSDLLSAEGSTKDEIFISKQSASIRLSLIDYSSTSERRTSGRIEIGIAVSKKELKTKLRPAFKHLKKYKSDLSKYAKGLSDHVKSTSDHKGNQVWVD